MNLVRSEDYLQHAEDLYELRDDVFGSETRLREVRQVAGDAPEPMWYKDAESAVEDVLESIIEMSKGTELHAGSTA